MSYDINDPRNPNSPFNVLNPESPFYKGSRSMFWDFWGYLITGAVLIAIVKLGL